MTNDQHQRRRNTPPLYPGLPCASLRNQREGTRSGPTTEFQLSSGGGVEKGKIMRVEGSLLPLLVTPLVRALLVLLAVPLVVVEALLVETVPEPHYGEKFYQYGYQVEDLYTGDALLC